MERVDLLASLPMAMGARAGDFTAAIVVELADQTREDQPVPDGRSARRCALG